MDIQEHLEIAFLTGSHLILEVGSDEFHFGEADLEPLWVIVCEEVTVHIFTLRVATVISCDDTIRVDNGCDPKFVKIPHLVADNLPRHQEVDESVNDEGRVRLSAVLPANDDNDRLLGGTLTFAFVCYLQDWHVKVAIRRAQRLILDQFVV